jgi:hypothetical protein
MLRPICKRLSSIRFSNFIAGQFGSFVISISAGRNGGFRGLSDLDSS